MKPRRVERLNSLLKEVISEVISQDVKHPDLHELTTVTSVEVSKDLHHAKVFISVIGNDLDKKNTLLALESAAGFIAIHASKKVVLRHFPQLTFKIDNSVDEHLRIEEILHEIHEKDSSREHDA